MKYYLVLLISFLLFGCSSPYTIYTKAKYIDEMLQDGERELRKAIKKDDTLAVCTGLDIDTFVTTYLTSVQRCATMESKYRPFEFSKSTALFYAEEDAACAMKKFIIENKDNVDPSSLPHKYYNACKIILKKY